MAGSTWRLLHAHVTRRVLSPACVVAHIGVVLVGGTMLVLVNAIGSPGELWFWRPVLLLSGLLALHAILIMAAGRTSRLRLAAAWVGSLWAHLLARRPAWTGGGALRSTLRSLPRRWEPALQPPAAPAERPALASAPSAYAPAAWTEPPPATAAYGSWPASPAVALPVTPWPEPAPTWTASWPAPPTVAAAPIRPTGIDTVLNGAQIANPENPRWDQLEVAASSWLAHRSPQTAAGAAEAVQ